MIIELTAEELERCLEFSQTSAENQQTIEFGQSDTESRPTQEIARDNYIGKIAEVAFAKMIKDSYGIEIELDFAFYPRGQWDKQDAVINGWKIDVKGTRQGGSWLLVEWSKINFRQREKDLPHVFVMASVGWNRGTDQPTGKVDIVGCSNILRLQRGIENTEIFRKGDHLPGKNFPLQADNFGIRFENLKSDWDAAVNYMLSHPPLPLDDYPNPYDGSTYRTLFPGDYR